MVSRPIVRVFALIAAGARVAAAEDTPPAAAPGAGERPAEVRLAEVSRSLEAQARELFLDISARRGASEALLLHSHNFMGATRSFAHLVAEGPPDAELWRLSYSLLAREAELLAPLLPPELAERSFVAARGSMAELQALLLGLAAEPEEEDPTRPRVTVESDGWHGNLLDRFLRVKGGLEGIGLERCDVVITDAKNRVVWSQQDQLPEISAHYRNRPWQRVEPAKIRFSLRIDAERFAEGANFVTFTLTDVEGRQAVDTIAVGK